MFSPFSPIPQPQNPFEAFQQGMTTSQNMFNSIMQNKQVAANTATTEAKLPYVGPQAQADLINQQNINKWYGPKAQSEINLQGATAADSMAEAALRHQLLNDPALGAQGPVGDIARARASALLSGASATSIVGASPNVNPGPVDSINQNNPANSPSVSSPILQKFPQLMPGMTAINPQQNLMQQIQAGLSPNVPSNMSAVPNNMMPNSPLISSSGLPNQSQSVQAQGTQSDQQPLDYNALTQRALQAQVDQEEAKANWYNMGGGRGSASIQQQQMYQRDLQRDNPNFTPDQVFEAQGNLLQGKTTLNDGTPIIESGVTQQNRIAFQDSKAPVAVKNQAANYDVLVDDMKNIPIDNIARFAGPVGKAQLLDAKAKMAIDPNDPSIDQNARNYFTAVSQTIATMDQMRKAWGTSVVPEYVYKTVGRLANPNDSMFNDSKQVTQTYNAITNQMSKIRDDYMAKVRGGVTASANTNQGSGSAGNTNTPTPNTSSSAPQQIDYKRVDGKLVKVSS